MIPHLLTRRAIRALALSCGLITNITAIGCESQPAEQGERIVISGASGQLGGRVVEELLARGVQPANLILVSRTPERLERYAELGASTRFGDFTQPESLDTAYEGGTRLLLISLNSNNVNPSIIRETRAEFHQIAIDAAVEAGIEHIVYTSFVDADNNVSPIAPAHRATEAALRESGITWTALRNQWYADGLVTQAARMIEARRVLVSPDDPGTAFVTREDCAVAAALALTTPGHENRVYEITGPEAVRMREVASIAGELSGIDIEVIEAGPEDEVRAPPPSGTTLTTHFRDITGQPGTSVRDLLEANRDVLLEARGG